MGIGTIALVLVIGVLLVAVYAFSRGALHLLLRSLPIKEHRAHILAKDWSTILAMPLSGWVVLAPAIGPDYPIAIGITSTLIAALAPIIVQYSHGYLEQEGPRGTWKRYMVTSFGLVVLSITLAFAALWALPHVIMAPKP